MRTPAERRSLGTRALVSTLGGAVVYASIATSGCGSGSSPGSGGFASTDASNTGGTSGSPNSTGGKPSSGGMGGSSVGGSSPASGGSSPTMEGGTTGGTTGSGGSSTGGAPAMEAGVRDAGKPKCGNGVLDPGEECDDGNTLDQDSCTSICTDNRPCLACEAVADGCTSPEGQGCSTESGELPLCALFLDGDSNFRDDCYEVYSCFVRTGCAVDPRNSMGAFCFCGDKDLLTDCADGLGDGPCKDVVEQVAKRELQPPPGANEVTWAQIVQQYSNPPGLGFAINLAELDNFSCGSPTYGGHWECSPTMHPPFVSPDAGSSDSGSH